MTEHLQQEIAVPKWILYLFLSLLIGVSASGFNSVSELKTEMVEVRTSKIYIEKKLDKILEKLEEHMRDHNGSRLGK